MAGPDLGEPRNRETPRTEAPENVDILGGLEQVGAAVKEGIATHVINKTREEYEKVPEDVAQEAAVELTRAEEVPGRGQDLTGDPAVDAVKAKIGKLQSIVGATSGSVRARAELELRREMDKAASKFPGLRAALAQELRLFEATDPEFQLLAMVDTERQLANEEAAKEIERMRDFAYARAPDGLGLTPGLHEFGSAEFSAHLAYKGALIEEAQTRLIVLEDANTGSQVTAEQSAQRAINFFSGDGAPYRQAIEEAASVMWQAAEAARNVTSPGASEQLSAWENGGKQEVIANLQAVRADTVARMGKLFSSRELAVSETAKQAQKQLESELAALDEVVAALSGDETNWNVVRAYETWNTTRQATFDSRFPREADARLVIKNVLPFIEAAEGSFGNLDALAKNQVANFALHQLRTVGGYAGVTDILSGGGMVGMVGETNPYQVLGNLEGIRQDNQRYLNNGQQGNLANQSSANLHSRVTRVLDDVEVSPKMAAQMTLAHASDTIAVARGPQFDDLAEDQLKTLASPAVLEHAKQAKQAGNPLAGQALGLAARELDVQFEPIRRKQWAKAVQESGGVVVVNLDQLDKGKILFVVDDAAIQARAEQFVRGDEYSSIGSETARIRRRAMDQAAKMTAQFTEDLAYLANMDALQFGEDYEPNYRNTYKRYAFDQYLAEPDE